MKKIKEQRRKRWLFFVFTSSRRDFYFVNCEPIYVKYEETEDFYQKIAILFDEIKITY